MGEALDRVRRLVPGMRTDDWAPSVPGAVGHVVGLRDAGSERYVLKVYPAGAGARFETEVLALRPAADVPGLGVPRVVLSALRRSHEVRGPRFGSLAEHGPGAATAWEWTAVRTDGLVTHDVGTGGPRHLGAQVRRFVVDRRGTVETSVSAALCHHDFIDGNLLLADGPQPRLSGVVDFEAAGWDDPLSDLAQTRVHVRFHAPTDDGDALLGGYGITTADERERSIALFDEHLATSVVGARTGRRERAER